MRTTAIAKLIFAFVLVTGTIAACGGSGSDGGPSDLADALTDTDINLDDESVNIRTEDGELELGSCSSIPDGFPEGEVPLPDAEPTNCVRQAADGEVSFLFNYVDSSVDVDDYRDDLEDAGFSIESEYEFAGGDEAIASFTATGEDWMVNVSSVGSGAQEGFVNVGVIGGSTP